MERSQLDFSMFIFVMCAVRVLAKLSLEYHPGGVFSYILFDSLLIAMPRAHRKVVLCLVKLAR